MVWLLQDVVNRYLNGSAGARDDHLEPFQMPRRIACGTIRWWLPANS